jgi:hypothetical protein
VKDNFTLYKTGIYDANGCSRIQSTLPITPTKKELIMAWNKTNEQNTRSNNNNGQEREKTQSWLNIGFTSTDSNGDDVFISLPLGLAIDTMKPSNVPNKDSDYRDMTIAKNELLDQLQKLIAGMEPGQTEIIETLQIQVRRVDEAAQEEGPSDRNPHLSNLSRLGFTKKAA